MAIGKVNIKPTDGEGGSWENIGQIFDNDIETAGQSGTSSVVYKNRTLKLNFNIPKDMNIIKATLNVRMWTNKDDRGGELRVDLNQYDGSRIMTQKMPGSATLYSADITQYISSLNSLVVTPYSSSVTGCTLYISDLYIYCEYHAPTQNIYAGGNKIVGAYYNTMPIKNIYLGQNLVFDIKP